MKKSSRLLKVIIHIGSLVTNELLARKIKTPTSSKNPTSVSDEDLGIIDNAFLIIENSTIIDFGRMQNFNIKDFEKKADVIEIIDAKNYLVMPGLIDSHTHMLFEGLRSGEFTKRLAGMSYQQIAESGGGIKSSVKATREASDEKLISLLQNRLIAHLKQGITTIECKTGYGLSYEEELRQLYLLTKVKDRSKNSLTLVRTCLALHAVGPEAKDKKSYISEIEQKLLPIISRENLCDFVDAFVEKNYFEPKDVESYFQTCKELKLSIRLHADEFLDSGAASFAAKMGAVSADHLQAASEEGLKQLADADTIATILPGTSLYCGIPFAKAETFRKAGLRIALASDFNPGSCSLSNLANILCLGSVHCGLTAPEAIAAVTLHAAKSLGLHKSKGALIKGYDADLVIFEAKNYSQWLAAAGSVSAIKVFHQGQQIKF